MAWVGPVQGLHRDFSSEANTIRMSGGFMYKAERSRRIEIIGHAIGDRWISLNVSTPVAA